MSIKWDEKDVIDTIRLALLPKKGTPIKETTLGTLGAGGIPGGIPGDWIKRNQFKTPLKTSQTPQYKNQIRKAVNEKTE